MNPISDFHQHANTLPLVFGGGAPAIQAPRKSLVRVLHLINGEHYSGAERVQDLLGLRLSDEGFEVGFACLKPDRFPSMRQSTGPIYEVAMRHRADVAIVRRLVKLVRQHDYRLLHAHTPRTALIGRLVAAWTRRPLIYHVHSPTSRDSTNFARNALNQWTELMCIGGASRLVTVSYSLAKHMRRLGVPARRIRVVPNGVPSANRRRPGGAPSADWVIGTVALIRPRKGVEVLLDALAKLHQAGLPARLRVVGPFETPEYEQAIKSRTTSLGLDNAVEWVGFTRHVEAELHRMDVFALPSLFGEGLPMVVLEAMAVGLPIVSTHVEGIPEAVRDGVDGLLAAPNSAEDLASCLSHLIRGEANWAELSENAYRRHAEAFSDRAMAAGVAAVYRDALTAG